MEVLFDVRGSRVLEIGVGDGGITATLHAKSRSASRASTDLEVGGIVELRDIGMHEQGAR